MAQLSSTNIAGNLVVSGPVVAQVSVAVGGTLTATNIVGPVTGHASSDLALAGGTISGPLILANGGVLVLGTVASTVNGAMWIS